MELDLLTTYAEKAYPILAALDTASYRLGDDTE
jgi:hypothetical protein